jgi:hypothetical protein
VDCLRSFGEDGHKPSRKHERARLYDEGFIPSDAAVGHCSLNGGVPLTIGSGDGDIKASRHAVRWNDEVRATDN